MDNKETEIKYLKFAKEIIETHGTPEFENVINKFNKENDPINDVKNELTSLKADIKAINSPKKSDSEMLNEKIAKRLREAKEEN